MPSVISLTTSKSYLDDYHYCLTPTTNYPSLIDYYQVSYTWLRLSSMIALIRDDHRYGPTKWCNDKGTSFYLCYTIITNVCHFECAVTTLQTCAISRSLSIYHSSHVGSFDGQLKASLKPLAFIIAAPCSLHMLGEWGSSSTPLVSAALVYLAHQKLP